MLVPQTQLCQRCGRLPAFVTSVCPSCGAGLPLPWPCQISGSSFPPVVGIPPQPHYQPLLVEVLLNFIGIYGVGWLMIGNIAGGLVLLIGSLLLWPVVALLSIFTLGLFLLCLGPVAIVAVICNVLLLQQAIKRKTC